jgi:two-component system, NtrC family, sensor kinase
MRIFSTLLFIAQGLLLSQAAYGQATLSPAVLLENPGQISLNGRIEYLEDKEGILTIDEVVVSRNFIDAGEDAPNFGFTDSVYWFRFSITNHTNQSALLLEQGYTHIDHISLYASNSEGGFKEQQSGDMLPFKNRARDYRTITFEIQIEPGATRLFFVRTQTSSSTQLPLKVYKEATFAQVSEREAAALGAFYGIILVMIVFNTLLWMSLRDKTYLSYVGYLAFYLLTQLTLNGNALRYIFPESPNLNAIALPLSIFTTIFFICRFTREFMSLENILPRASRVIVWAERILLVSAIASTWVPYAIIIKPAALVGVLGPFFFLILGVACVRKGYHPARAYLTAWSIFLFGILVFGLKTFGILPSNAFTEFSIQVGSALEVTLLSLALADRIHVVQEKEAASQAALLKTYKALDKELTNRENLEKQNTALHKDIQLASDQLIQADKLSTLGALAAGVAHDIASPTQFIVSGVDASNQCIGAIDERLIALLDQDSMEAREVYERFKKDLNQTEAALSDISLGARRITSINEAIRNQSRSDTAPDTHLLKPLIEECATILGNKLTFCEVKIECDEHISVFARRSHIGQVLTNLISNAADALTEHKSEDAPIIQIQAATASNMVHLSISDNGPGIPEDMREKILEPFFTTKEVGKGTGLGMPICVRIIETHGSKLEIDKSPHLKGARFSFSLPTTQTQGEQA